MVDLHITFTEEKLALKKAVADLCQLYPGSYWRELDAKREYPDAFVQELSTAGYRRQRGGLPRANVHHGDAAAAWLG